MPRTAAAVARARDLPADLPADRLRELYALMWRIRLFEQSGGALLVVLDELVWISHAGPLART